MGKAQAVRIGVSVANAALRVVFAPQCAACTAPLARPIDGCVCCRCWSAIEPPPAVGWPEDIIAAAAAGGDYAGALRQIVHAFKYEGRRSLAAPLGELMREHGRQVLSDATCVIPVPLHPWRRLNRGFNQAEDLARTLGPPVTAVLWRRRHTTAQADLTAMQRRRNVAEAFAVWPLLSRRHREFLRGAVVVLIDDVRTTGATLHACAVALGPLGVREVRILTAAVRAYEPGAKEARRRNPSEGVKAASRLR